MMAGVRLLARGCPVLLALGLCVGAAAAAPQPSTSTGVPNALQGFSQNRNEPVKIDAATLDVRDKDKIATFSGDVHVVQGDTDLRCKVLVVFYDQEEGAGNLKAAQPGPGGQQQIRRLEANGGVIVTQKDQTATGGSGVFDMKTNTVTLRGGVVVTQGQNVLKGDRLVVDLDTGTSRLESGKGSNGRVQGLFQSKPEALDSKDKKPETPASTGKKPRSSSSPAARNAPLSLGPIH